MRWESAAAGSAMLALAALVACASPPPPALQAAVATLVDADAGRDAAIDGAIAYLPTKNHDTWPFATPCVEDAKKRAMESEPHDIDRDGTPDWMVTEIGKKNRRGYVYLARGACAHFAGEWEGGPKGPVPSDDGTMSNA